MVFFILGQMGHSGGGSVDTFHQLSVYTTRVVEMKRNTQAEMRPYIILSYISPVLLVFGVTFVGGVLTGSYVVHSSGSGCRDPHSGIFHPELFQVSDVLIAGRQQPWGHRGEDDRLHRQKHLESVGERRHSHDRYIRHVGAQRGLAIPHRSLKAADGVRPC